MFGDLLDDGVVSVASLIVGVAAAGAAPSRFVQDPYPSTYSAVASGPVLIRGATVLTGTGTPMQLTLSGPSGEVTL